MRQRPPASRIQRMSDSISRVALTVLYFTLNAPVALAVRFLMDPLAIKSKPRSLWVKRSKGDSTIDEARRLY